MLMRRRKREKRETYKLNKLSSQTFITLFDWVISLRNSVISADEPIHYVNVGRIEKENIRH